MQMDPKRSIISLLIHRPYITPIRFQNSTFLEVPLTIDDMTNARALISFLFNLIVFAVLGFRIFINLIRKQIGAF